MTQIERGSVAQKFDLIIIVIIKRNKTWWDGIRWDGMEWYCRCGVVVYVVSKYYVSRRGRRRGE